MTHLWASSLRQQHAGSKSTSSGLSHCSSCRKSQTEAPQFAADTLSKRVLNLLPSLHPNKTHQHTTI